ncbi:type II toxin-antitoxin system HicB family antitoxin [uncultured Methylobacterium sp.]|uniref:type II toxin-antitoxin system HicB family antitoxin n=1 Tax=uncultured Methylobacterium sp. TaxID=157278 RepID=UPI0035CB061F
MNERLYPIVIFPLTADDGGGFAATVPDLPGCLSDGETPEEALVNVRDAIEAWIAMARDLGHAVPPPTHAIG